MDNSNLQRKALIGFAQLIIALGIMLFAPTWSMRYWQGWIFLLVFSVAVLAITLYFLKTDTKLIEKRLKAGPSAEQNRNQKIIQTFASLFFILLFIVSSFDHRFHWSDIPIYAVIMGDIFVLLGLLIVFLVFKENSYTSATIEVEKEQKVISTGPYSIVRHPMYAGALLMLFFVPIALGSLWGVFFAIPMLVVIVWRLIDEERFLSKNLPGYKEYMQKSNYRLIPFIW